MKSNARRISLIVAFIFIVFFAGSVCLQIYNNRMNADESASMILDQLEDVAEETEASNTTLMETLKDEYTVRADMIALMLNDHEDREITAEEYQDLAKHSSVDEIHLFDETGTIIGGSNPEYYGYSFDSGEQMAYFKPMLSDKTKSMCQDVTENTAERKPMMYAITWAKCGKHMVQVGISPERLLEQMENNDIKSLIDKIPVTEGMDIYLIDIDSGTIVGGTNKGNIGEQAKSNSARMKLLETKVRHQKTRKLDGETYYVQYERLEDYVVVVTYMASTVNDNLPFMMLILAAVLFLSFCLVSVVVSSAFQATEASLRRVERANQAKTQFLSRMSHDIRTPLNGIIGLLEIDEKHADDRELVDSNRKKAKVAADHLLSLISDVLELSKMDDENVELAHEPFDITKLAEDILTITELRAAEAGITLLHEDCKENVMYPYVYGSPLHVKRIILNIFSNAIKYNKPNGSITCKMQMLSKNDQTVVYQVVITDTGIGMSPDFLTHMFEPFSQEHTDARSTYQGTGLGMAIVKSLLDKMNGTIEVESTEGTGSTFTVTIPFETALETDLPKKKEMQEIDLEGIKVLLVEDNDLNMEIATAILEDAGVSVTKAQNGLEAVELFVHNKSGTYDLILMDLMMPVMDGYEATRTIRSCEREDAKSIPIVAMTANAFAEDAQKCLEAGMDGHLAKPIEVPKLMETLASLLK